MTKQPQIWYIPWFPRFVGITLPPFGIFIVPSRASLRTLLHEMAHWQQYRERGLLGFYLGYVWEWVKAGFSYTDHPWEVEARRIAKSAMR